MHSLTVALDVGPLHGHRTGVGTATAHLLDAIEARDDVTALPYLTSFRARPTSPQRRLPLPAALAMRTWSRVDHPRVDRWLRGADLVHGTNYVAPPSQLPTVISVYDCWFLANPDEASPSVHLSAQVLRRAARRGARIHVSSQATAEVAGELLGTDRVSVVHLGLPPTSGPAVGPVPSADGIDALDGLDGLDGCRYVVTVGTVERRKDIPSLVEAFGLLAADHRDLHLVVVGAPGDDQYRLDAAIAQLDPHALERVHVTGAVDRAAKDALIAGAATLAYPSLDEGFGFPILEAQLAGTPVVACRAGSIPEVGGRGVELVEPTSIEALATGIARVLDDDAYARSLTELGRANTERFSWERTCAELIDVYRLAVDEQT